MATLTGLFRAWRKEERRAPLERGAVLRTLGVCVAVLLPLVSLQVMRRSQYSLQQDQANRSDTLAIMESALALTDRAARDWGHWDDAYQFAQGRNPSFEQISLSTAGLFDGGVVMVILDRAGQLLLTHAAPDFQLPDYRDLIRCTRDNRQRLPGVRSTVRLACVTGDGALFLGAATPISDHTAAAPSAGTLAIFDPMLKQEHAPLIRERLTALRRDLVLQSPAATARDGTTETIRPLIHAAGDRVLAMRRPSRPQVVGRALLDDLPLLGTIPVLLLTLRMLQQLSRRRARVQRRQVERQANRRLRQACRQLEELLGGSAPIPWTAGAAEHALPLDRLILDPQERPGGALTPAPAAGSRWQDPLLERLTSRFQAFVNNAGNLALLDSLTQLPNRRYFLLQVAEMAAAHRRLDRHFAVLFVDIDKFKFINDSYGHNIGDGVLVCVCQRLAARLNPGDFLARYGGDELALIIDLAKLADHSSAADCNRAARQRAESLEACMADPVVIGEHTIIVSLSIGITLVDPQEQDIAAVIQRSDQAMYQAKRSRLNRIIGPDDLVQAPQLTTYQLFNDLVQAISSRGLQVFFQPIGDGRGPWQGMEALARWWHPGQGWIEPQVFLELAEQHRQMQVLGPELIRHSLDGFLTMQQIRPQLLLYLNVSPSQLLDPTLAATLLDELRLRGIPPAQLVLELTEHSILEPNPCVLGNLQGLRTAGVRLALDDFGTGYSSLVLLQTLRPDVVKIDKAFTQSLGGADEALPILELMAGLAPRMQLELIAEGIEDAATMERLRAMGCTLFQGFLLARPAPATDWAQGLAAADPAAAPASPDADTKSNTHTHADRNTDTDTVGVVAPIP